MRSVETAQLAAERYALLVQQLGQELGYGYGWKSAVARTLGVHPSYISRVHKGDRTGIGGAVIARAIESLDLDRSFFTSPEEVTDYRAFVRHTATEEDFQNRAPRAAGLLGAARADVEADWEIAGALARHVFDAPGEPEPARELAAWILERSILARHARLILAGDAPSASSALVLASYAATVATAIEEAETRAESEESAKARTKSDSES